MTRVDYELVGREWRKFTAALNGAPNPEEAMSDDWQEEFKQWLKEMESQYSLCLYWSDDSWYAHIQFEGDYMSRWHEQREPSCPIEAVRELWENIKKVERPKFVMPTSYEVREGLAASNQTEPLRVYTIKGQEYYVFKHSSPAWYAALPKDWSGSGGSTSECCGGTPEEALRKLVQR